VRPDWTTKKFGWNFVARSACALHTSTRLVFGSRPSDASA
jgi:hypothetical protein